MDRKPLPVIIDAACLAAQLTASYDEIVYLRLLHGEPAPQGVDISALLRRVEHWEREALINIIGSKGNLWWYGLLVASLSDACQRRRREYLKDGNLLQAHLETWRKWWAYSGVLQMALRYSLFPNIYLDISPLHRVIAYTSA